MKLLLLLLFLTLMVSCSNSKKVYWCGDHPCINKKEKQTYFQKNMIVEVRNINKNDKKLLNDIEKIMQQAKVNQKKQIKINKELAKQARIDEKKRKKREKKLAKENRKNEKKLIKNKKKSVKQKEKKSEFDKTADSTTLQTTASTFANLVEKVTKQNMSRPYPDINDIPN